MSREFERTAALPQLYGAPAVYRRRSVAPDSDRPLDQDDLPIAAAQSAEDRAIASGATPPVGWVPPSRRAAIDDVEPGDGWHGLTSAWGTDTGFNDHRVGQDGWDVASIEIVPHATDADAPPARPFRIRALATRLLGGRPKR